MQLTPASRPLGKTARRRTRAAVAAYNFQFPSATDNGGVNRVTRRGTEMGGGGGRERERGFDSDRVRDSTLMCDDILCIRVGGGGVGGDG